MRISDWSSDVCSSDLRHFGDAAGIVGDGTIGVERDDHAREREHRGGGKGDADDARGLESDNDADADDERRQRGRFKRSEEHTSELQSLMRISYAVFCLKKKQMNKPHKLRINQKE